MQQVIKLVRSIVRPLVTTALVGAQIALAFMFFAGDAEVANQAFAALSPFTSTAVVFWFKDRSDENSRT